MFVLPALGATAPVDSLLALLVVLVAKLLSVCELEEDIVALLPVTVPDRVTTPTELIVAVGTVLSVPSRALEVVEAAGVGMTVAVVTKVTGPLLPLEL